MHKPAWSAGLKTQYGTQTTRYYLLKLPNNYEEPFQKGVIWALQRIAPRGTPSNLHYAFSRLQVHCIHSVNTQSTQAGFCVQPRQASRRRGHAGKRLAHWFSSRLWPWTPLFKEKLFYGKKRKDSQQKIQLILCISLLCCHN